MEPSPHLTRGCYERAMDGLCAKHAYQADASPARRTGGSCRVARDKNKERGNLSKVEARHYRFYVGRIKTAIIMLSLSIVGAATAWIVIGIPFILAVLAWALVNLIYAIAGITKDSQGRFIKNW